MNAIVKDFLVLEDRRDVGMLMMRAMSQNSNMPISRMKLVGTVEMAIDALDSGDIKYLLMDVCMRGTTGKLPGETQMEEKNTSYAAGVKAIKKGIDLLFLTSVNEEELPIMEKRLKEFAFEVGSKIGIFSIGKMELVDVPFKNLAQKCLAEGIK